MKKLTMLAAGVALMIAVPASAQTVVIKKGHGHQGARAEMRGHHGGGNYGMRSHGHGKTVVIKQRRHHRH